LLRNEFNKAMENIRISPIVSISEQARDLAPSFRKETGKELVLFQRGEVSGSTPQYIKNAAIKALADEKTKYPKSGGEPILKEAILRKMESNGISGLTTGNIVCTYGGQEALQLAFKLFEGERGASFSPCWSCILENQAPYANVPMELIPLNDNFSIDFGKVAEVLDKVSFFYLNTPQNPSGTVISEEDIRTIVEMCYEKDVFVISDEAYEDIVFDGEHFSALATGRENVIAAYTFSKSFAMTGWRLGYLVSRHSSIPRLVTGADYSQTAGVTTFMQYAGAEALNNVEEKEKFINSSLEEYKARRDVLYDGLIDLGLDVQKPESTFYMFPSFSKFIPKDLDGKKRKEYIFKAFMKEGVATVPGHCFGKGFDDNVRISFSTTPIPVILDGVERIGRALGL